MPNKSPDNAYSNTENNKAEQCQGVEQAILRFEKIMMSRIYVQQRLGDRLKLSIRTGMVVLFLLASAILLLLVTLSIQVSRVADVADNMSKNFFVISKSMQTINQYMGNMEQQVAFLPKIQGKTAQMGEHMVLMNSSLAAIKTEMMQMKGNLSQVQTKMVRISGSVKDMDTEVGYISGQVNRISKPANAINKVFPF
ncbi:MAG: hypothetical protein QM479_15530 [Pseudomonadota bacterium]